MKRRIHIEPHAFWPGNIRLLCGRVKTNLDDTIFQREARGLKRNDKVYKQLCRRCLRQLTKT